MCAELRTRVRTTLPPMSAIVSTLCQPGVNTRGSTGQSLGYTVAHQPFSSKKCAYGLQRGSLKIPPRIVLLAKARELA
jgi:hypothetical protein